MLLFLYFLGCCRIGEKIGSGEFGDVCKGFWKSMDYIVDVALKTQCRTEDQGARVKLLQEAAIMSQFKHTNVIKLYGVVNDSDQVCHLYQNIQLLYYAFDIYNYSVNN